VLVGNLVATAVFLCAKPMDRKADGFQQKLSRNATLRALGPAVERESWKIILLRSTASTFPD